MNTNSPRKTALLTRGLPYASRLAGFVQWRAKKRLHLATPVAVLMLLGSAGLVQAVPLTSQVVFGGAGDQQGTGVAVSAGNVYYSGINGATSDGISGRYNGSLTTQSWSLSLGGSPGDFQGVAVSNSVYTAGSSRNGSLVADGVGGFENKSVVASVGLGGGAYNWRTQTPGFGTPFLPYSGTEGSTGIAISTSAGVDSIYTVGFAQANGGASGYNMTLSKLNQAGSTVATAVFNTGIGTFGNGITTLGGNVFAVGNTASSVNAVIRAYNGNLGFLWTDTSLAGSYNSVTAYNGDIYAVGVSGTNGIVSRYNATTGARLWTQSYAGDVLNGVVGYGGVLYAAGSTGSDALLLGLDAATGAVQTTQTFGGTGTDVFNDITLNSADGSFYAIGATDSASLGANGKDVWIAQFVPEPASAALLGFGALLFAAQRRRNT